MPLDRLTPSGNLWRRPRRGLPLPALHLPGADQRHQSGVRAGALRQSGRAGQRRIEVPSEARTLRIDRLAGLRQRLDLVRHTGSPAWRIRYPQACA